MSEIATTEQRTVIPRARLHPTRAEQLRAKLFADRYLVQEMADALGVHWRTVYNYTAQGCPYHLVGNQRTYVPDEVRDWMSKRRKNMKPRPVGRPRKGQK